MDQPPWAMPSLPVLIGLIPRQLGGTSGTQPATQRADIREGLRYRRRHPIIWPLTASGFGSALTAGTRLTRTPKGCRRAPLPLTEQRVLLRAGDGQHDSPVETHLSGDVRCA